MEDKNDTVSMKDKVVGAIRRNKVRIAYCTVGVGVGIVATRVYGRAAGVNFYNEVVDAVQATGEYRLPGLAGGIDLAIKEATES